MGGSSSESDNEGNDSPIGKNIIKNPHAADGLDHWEIIENGGDKFIVEEAHGGKAPGVDDGDSLDLRGDVKESLNTWTTSNMMASKKQKIDLIEAGFDDDYLDKEPTVKIREWVSARADCAASYYLKVKLINGDGEVMDEFHKEFEPEQGKWTKVQHAFKDYGKGLRHIEFEHGGKDQLFWAGHYGSKFTGSEIKIGKKK